MRSSQSTTRYSSSSRSEWMAGTTRSWIATRPSWRVSAPRSSVGFESMTALDPGPSPRGSFVCVVPGVGGTPCSRTPVQVPGGVVFADISAGGGYTCGVTALGQASCWDSGAPAPLPGALALTSIAAGTASICGLTSAGGAYCWSRDGWHPGPVVASGVETFIAVNAGSLMPQFGLSFGASCAVAMGGAAYCWGNNSFGQLGDGTTTNAAAPKAVVGGLSFVSVGAGLEHTCGLTTAGDAYCWGQNTGLQVQGQLGDGTNSPSSTPVRVNTTLKFVQLQVGRQFTCARTADGRISCWGDNRFGQLGHGDPYQPNSSTPVGVAGVS